MTLRDTLGSVPGLEEDGVEDNRMEPPSGGPGESPDGTPSGEKDAKKTASLAGQGDQASQAAVAVDKATSGADSKPSASETKPSGADNKKPAPSAATDKDPDTTSKPAADDAGRPSGAVEKPSAPAEKTRGPFEKYAGQADQPSAADKPFSRAGTTRPSWAGTLATGAMPGTGNRSNGEAYGGSKAAGGPATGTPETPADRAESDSPPAKPPSEPLSAGARQGPVYPDDRGSPYPGSRATAAAAAQTAPIPTVAAVADSMRGMAAKVGSSFSGLSGKLGEKTRPSHAAPASGHHVPPAQLPRVARPPVGRPRRTPRRGQPRRAQLTLERLEPWSVMKFSFLISLVCWVILFIVVAVLYFTLSKLGVFHSLETNWSLVTSSKSNPSGSKLTAWLSASRVLGYTMLIGAVNVVLMTALATLGAVVYNLITTLTGGIEVTLKESD